MEYSPKGNTKRSDVVIIGLFALAVSSFAAANLPVRFSWAFRVLGLFALTGAVYAAVRYRLSQFVYTLGGEVGDEVFMVFLDRGRRKVAQCRLTLSELVSVRRYADEGAAKEAQKGYEVYSYVQSMSPDSLVICVFKTSGERDLCVVLECDEAFERALAEYAERNLRDATAM